MKVKSKINSFYACPELFFMYLVWEKDHSKQHLIVFICTDIQR